MIKKDKSRGMKLIEEKKCIWNTLATPPKGALKKITGGRLDGFTDIKPQWRLKALTDCFGACGSGWRVEISDIWTDNGPGDQQLVNVKIDLFYIREDGSWSEAVPGIGSGRLVAQEKKGPYMSDEAVKGALTDAISVAGKMIGLAADVYMGYWDGSKYNTPDEPDDIIYRIKNLETELIDAGQISDHDDFEKRVSAKFGTSLLAMDEAQLLSVETVLNTMKGVSDGENTLGRAANGRVVLS